MKLYNRIKDYLFRLEQLDLKSKDFVRPQYIKEALKIKYSTAKLLLDMAVRSGLLKQKYNVLSPHDEKVIKQFNYLDDIPETVQEDPDYPNPERDFIKSKHLEQFVEKVYRYE